MNILSNNSMFMMERSMDYLWTKQTHILDNIANVETPDYKPTYATTFEESLRQAVQSADAGSPKSGEMYRSIAGAEVKVEQADVSNRLDGNGVNITAESIELSRNALQIQYVMNAISSELSLVRTAIRG